MLVTEVQRAPELWNAEDRMRCDRGMTAWDGRLAVGLQEPCVAQVAVGDEQLLARRDVPLCAAGAALRPLNLAVSPSADVW